MLDCLHSIDYIPVLLSKIFPVFFLLAFIFQKMNWLYFCLSNKVSPVLASFYICVCVLH